jgi:hypothetical protein
MLKKPQAKRWPKTAAITVPNKIQMSTESVAGRSVYEQMLINIEVGLGPRRQRQSAQVEINQFAKRESIAD